MSNPGDADDLSAGKVKDVVADAKRGEIEEDTQRRHWKTATLWFLLLLILGFYGLSLWLVICHLLLITRLPYVLALTVAVPTLLLIHLVKLVQPTQKNDTEEIIQGPWFRLAKELLDAVKLLLKSKS